MTQETVTAGVTPSQVVAQRLREIRTRRGLSAREVAELCRATGLHHMDRSVIANIETGRRRGVSVDELLALAYVLEVAPVHLLVPLEDTGVFYRFTPSWAAFPVAVRAWVRGEYALPGIDRRGFYAEIPESEVQELATTQAELDERHERRKAQVRDLLRHKGKRFRFATREEAD